MTIVIGNQILINFFRYVDQNLKVGTPKVFIGRSDRTGSNQMVPQLSYTSFMSQEDLKMAVSIPYLK